MTLPELYETLVVSLSNSVTLTYDGVCGSIFNEEIRRITRSEGNASALSVCGRFESKTGNTGSRRRSTSRDKKKHKEVTCYQCGRKGHK